jgi:hypothetical protein
MLCAMAQMSQITFQPALDPFHAIFRTIRILSELEQPILRDHLRILDFYLLFPFRIRSLRLLPRHQRFKKLATTYAHLTPYGEQPDAPLLFKRMEPMQLAAFETLASRSYINSSAFSVQVIKKTEREPPDELAFRVAELNKAQPDLIEFLRTLASEYELIGENGLKARSGLLEHRYDSI